MAAIELDRITKHFGGIQAVQEVTMRLESGSSYGLIGPNGAGKSTLFDMMTGIQQPTSGRLAVYGEDVTGWPSWKVAGLGVARTFQHTTVFDELTVGENLVRAAYQHDDRSVLSSIVLSKRYREAHSRLGDRAMEVSELLGLADRYHFTASDLAYGELRYLEIAIALMSRPRVLLLDEPAAGLSHAAADGLANIWPSISAGVDVTVLVDHNVDFVMKVSESVFVLDSGQLLVEGSPQEVAKDERVQEVYLGRS